MQQFGDNNSPILDFRFQFSNHPGSEFAHHMDIVATLPVNAIQSRALLETNSGLDSEFLRDDSSPCVPANQEAVHQATGVDKRFLTCQEATNESENLGELPSTPQQGTSNNDDIRCLFLIGDPNGDVNSWKKMGWTSVKDLMASMEHIFRMLKEAGSTYMSCLLYDEERRPEVERACARWGARCPRENKVCSLVPRRSFYSKVESLINPTRLSSAHGSTTVAEGSPFHALVTEEEKAAIEVAAGFLYPPQWRRNVVELGDVLTKRHCFGFDLDHVLHEFGSASTCATIGVLASMSRKFDVSYGDLLSRYNEELQIQASDAFVEGLTSREYLWERLVVAGDHVGAGLEDDLPFLYELLDAYEITLGKALELKRGVLDLLKTLKKAGKTIVVITECPEDAQQSTIENLGLSIYVDHVASSSQYKVSKPDGLFKKVLQKTGISPSDFVYVGHSEERDMKPAMAEGIFCLHYAELENYNLTLNPPRINTPGQLEYLVKWALLNPATRTDQQSDGAAATEGKLKKLLALFEGK